MIAQEKALSVTVNGSKLDLPQRATILDLLRILEADPALVAVEQNLLIVPKAEFSSRRISDGDSIEVVHFVGGG
ncbi:MAG TPA: sulfur carrier protein ThiS [Acidobacteriota bacterium]|nr:sulfur carrier protein ThiS [Acidobacteriota bacterium]